MTSILVVEDDKMLAKAVGHDLSDHQFQVTIVHSVAEALEALNRASIDVILTDLRLGAEDGIDLLARLCHVAPQSRTVLMSGFATARDYQRAIELGAVRVLCKPFTPAELVQCIRQAIECETGFRGSVHGLSLIDMLQMFNYARRSVSITISLPAHSVGRLHLQDGQLVHAEHGEQTGEPALTALLKIPGGTISTAALPPDMPRSVTRDFREVLLDALRAIDEGIDKSLAENIATNHSSDDELDLEFEFGALEADKPPLEAVAHESILRGVREMDGYIAACLVLSGSGGVLSFDGELDLRAVAPLTAEFVRRKQQTVHDMGIDDELEDVLITSTTQYHLLHSLHSEVPAFLHVVLDRKRTNPAMAVREIAGMTRALDL